MQLTLLVDNQATNGLRSEHGLSFLIESSEGSVLFDTGQSDAWLDNLTALGRDPARIKAIAISHGHYDHTGGLATAAQAAPDAQVFAHPECFEPKYAASPGATRHIGMSADGLSHKAAFKLNRCPVDVLPGVILSGEIPLRIGSIVSPGFLTGKGQLRPDTFRDEQCLIVRSGDATAVLLGCGHTGLENTVLAAMEVAGVRRIDLLAGGLHLGGAALERLESLVAFLQSTDIGRIACCHCTGVSASEYLRSKLGDQVELARAGSSWRV